MHNFKFSRNKNINNKNIMFIANVINISLNVNATSMSRENISTEDIQSKFKRRKTKILSTLSSRKKSFIA